MSDTVVKFEPREVGEGYRFDPDVTLDEAKGREHTTLLILGENAAGELYIGGNSNAGEAMILMEKAKRHICFGED